MMKYIEGPSIVSQDVAVDLLPFYDLVSDKFRPFWKIKTTTYNPLQSCA